MLKFTNLRRFLTASLALLLAGAVLPAADTKKAADAQLAHSVIFTLKDQSAKSREGFVAICDKYLMSHKGAVSYTCGTIAEDVKEPVSDREFDVALHVVFEDKAALAEYLKSDRHNQFVAAIKDKISKVRVFDSYLSASK
jgi:Stress responsive A/B Barrel Domain